MEKRINKRVEIYLTSFKDSIRNKINELEISEKSKANELMEYIYDYERLVINKDDLNKRKRIKNAIPSSNRCNAKRANNEQCTRRRKENSEFCGTHSKGAPNGMINEFSCCENSIKKLEVFVEEICGIVYYLDNFNNVYKTEDILENKQNPVIIARYNKYENKYSIPELGLYQ
jgi:hypothetical protein